MPTMKAGKVPKKPAKPKDKPRGSTSKGKKNKQEQERWEAVAEALFEVIAHNEFPEVEHFRDLPHDDDLYIETMALADSFIRLADNLIAPAMVQGLRKYQQQQRKKAKK